MKNEEVEKKFKAQSSIYINKKEEKHLYLSMK